MLLRNKNFFRLFLATATKTFPSNSHSFSLISKIPLPSIPAIFHVAGSFGSLRTFFKLQSNIRVIRPPWPPDEERYESQGVLGNRCGNCNLYKWGGSSISTHIKSKWKWRNLPRLSNEGCKRCPVKASRTLVLERMSQWSTSEVLTCSLKIPWIQLGWDVELRKVLRKTYRISLWGFLWYPHAIHC